MRATLIHNPTAGDTRPTARDIKKIVAAAGFQVRYQSSKKNWKKALKEDADLVVAAGGDGTVAKVLKELAGTRRPIAILPVGTANNIARTLGVSGDARDLAASWRKARARPFDLGRVKAGGQDLDFVEAAGGGLFAAAISLGENTVAEAASLVGNEIDRALTHLRRVVSSVKGARWTVEVDGVDFSGRYLGVEAMNIRYAGPSVPIAADADPGDGLLDVVMIVERDRQRLLAYIDQRLAQHEVQLPTFKTQRGRRIRLIAADDVPLRVDDAVVEDDAREWHVSVRRGAARAIRAERPSP